MPFYWKTANGVIYRADSWNSSDSTAITVYGYEMRTELANAQTSFGYVNHKLDNAYPPAVPDGFEYIPLGKLGDAVADVIGVTTHTNTVDTNINLGFRPKAVLVEARDGNRYSSTNQFFGGFALDGYPQVNTYNSSGTTYSYNIVSITDTGFTIHGYMKGGTKYYIAFR